MVRFDDAAVERQMAELLALGDRELLAVWTRVGGSLCEHATDEFWQVFSALMRALPIATASERMPNLCNWRWAGSALLSSTARNRIAMCMTIMQAREMLETVDGDRRDRS